MRRRTYTESPKDGLMEILRAAAEYDPVNDDGSCAENDTQI